LPLGRIVKREEAGRAKEVKNSIFFAPKEAIYHEKAPFFRGLRLLDNQQQEKLPD
jgi:hypothetical protein